MAEVTVSVAKKKEEEQPVDAKKALAEAVENIRQAASSFWLHPLETGYDNNDEFSPSLTFNMLHIVALSLFGLDHHFCINEARQCHWLGFIPYKQYRTVVEVSLNTGNILFSKNEIDCTVYDANLFDIVKRELSQCADALGIHRVNLTQDFVEK